MTAAPARPGLTAAEVVASRLRHGANVLTPPPRISWWREYLSKFNDPVIRILMIAAAIATLAGSLDGRVAPEGIGIIVAVLLATFLAFWNEFRANKEFDILNKSNDDVAVKVVRGGSYTLVPRREVVVGDLMFVEVGEEVPADGKLVEAVGLLVNEAKLTGEASPVEKEVGGTKPAGDAYGPDDLLRGTTVVDGYGLVEATAVGDGSEIGKTLRESSEETGDVSPLNRQLGSLSKVIGVVGFGVAVLTFAALVGRGAVTGELVRKGLAAETAASPLSGGEWLFIAALLLVVGVMLVKVWLPIVLDGLELAGVEASMPAFLEGDDDAGWWRGALPWIGTVVAGVVLLALLVAGGIAGGLLPGSPGEWLRPAVGKALLGYFMIAVTIIVVAVPEGLAMSVTLSLAYSMRKMTASNNLVRRMEACETIGAATVICSDKTGTLTLNEMRVVEGRFAGVNAAGLPADAGVRALVIEAIAANTTAQLSRDPGQPVSPVGNPTEGALLLWLDGGGTDYAAARAGFAVGTQWTFSTERKFMGTLGESGRLHVKGAPEIVLGRCTQLQTAGGPVALTTAGRDAVAAALHADQGRGMRTLGLAYREQALADADALEGVAVGLVWLGSVAIADPIRPEVPDAVAACRGAGVEVKMVTGDNAETAREIARQIGLWTAADPASAELTGAEFAALPDAEASEAAANVKVLSRARPADKLRLVSLLKGRGHVVAVTGDGVNDGPALNYADVGLAMGKSGTAVAKEASDIILLDDSFTSITTAIRWGRALYENIQRFILFQLTINVAALGLAVLGPFIGFELPLTVMQMLWVNLIMDTFAALALATEPPNPAVLSRPPRRADAFIVSRQMAISVFGVGAVFLGILVALTLYLLSAGELAKPDESSRGGTILFTVFVLLQFWNLFNAKCMNRAGSVFPTLGNNPSFLLIAAAILVGQVLIVQFGGSVFRTVPLSLTDWLTLLAATSVVLVVGEVARFLRRPSAT